MKYENVWYRDGSLRDIYVLDVTVTHWQQVLDWLQTNPYPIEFYLGGQWAPLPNNILTIFEQRNEVGVLLKIDFESVMLHSHFSWHKEIEFNVDQRDVDSEQKEIGITDFMREIGRLLNHEVLLTPENWKATSLLTYLPEQDEIIHNPVSMEPIETISMSREEGLRLMAKAYGLDEFNEAAVIEKMLEAVNKPAYEDD